jgi:short subunit dehydrogenase-like uncharacterized protein
MTKLNRTFDIIVYGASSFVGQILTEYLGHYSKTENADDISWAIAGRSESKLSELKSNLDLHDIEHFVADANDIDNLTDLASKTKVIITTVGPYALYGEAILQACVNTGTDYCDLTGEPQWIKEMLSKYESKAKETGARIINSAGFDSIPSDVGVYKTQQLALEKSGVTAKQIKMRVRKIKRKPRASKSIS